MYMLNDEYECDRKLMQNITSDNGILWFQYMDDIGYPILNFKTYVTENLVDHKRYLDQVFCQNGQYYEYQVGDPRKERYVGWNERTSCVAS